MPVPLVFHIRPLSMQRGFVLECEDMLADPLRLDRLIEAVLAAGQIGQGHEAKIQIFDTSGAVVEVLELPGDRVAQPFPV